MYWGIDRIGINHPEIQSAMVKKLALEKLKELIPDPDLDIDILRNLKRVPAVFVDYTRMPFLPISFSHQGNYISYAFISE